MMKKTTLLLITLLNISAITAQTWISEPSYKAQIVKESFVSKDQEVLIFSSYIYDSNTSSYPTTAFHTLDEGNSWQPMYKQDGSSLYTNFYTKIQDTLFNMEGNGSTGVVDVIYSLNNGVSWNTHSSANFGISYTSDLLSFHSFFGNFYVSREDSLIICNSDLSNPTIINQDFGDGFNPSGLKKIVQRNSDLFAISSPFQQVWKSSDQGVTWQNISYGVYSFEGIVEDNGSIYVNVYGGNVYQLDEINNQWSLLGNLGSNKSGEMNVNGDTIVAIDQNHIVISTDHGANFSNVESFERYGIYDGTMNPAINIPLLKKVNNTYIVGGYFGTMKANASTMTFESALKGHLFSRKVFDIVHVNGEQMQIGQYGMTYKYDDVNDVWIYLMQTNGNGNNESAYKPQLKAYGDTIFQTYGKLLMTTDMGTTWDTILDGGANWGAVPGAYMDMEIVGNSLFMGTDQGPYVTTDMGINWSNMQTGNQRTEALYYKNGELFYSQVQNDIYYSTDNGATFTSIHGNLPNQVMDIKVAGGTIFVVVNSYAGNTGNEIWHSDNRNGIWVQDTLFVDGTLDGSSFDLLECDDKIIVTTRNGMYMTSDLGTTWDTINYNLQPANTWEAVDKYPREFANDTLYAVSNDSIYKLYFPKTPVSVNESLINTNISVYPNPSQGVVNIISEENITEVNVFNMVGKQIFRKIVNAKNANLNMGDLPKGMYVINATTQKGKLQKILILE